MPNFYIINDFLVAFSYAHYTTNSEEMIQVFFELYLFKRRKVKWLS